MQSCWNTTRHHISSSFKWFCKIFQPYVPVNSKTAHPPPRAIPGHLTRVKPRTVGNLTQNEARPVGHLTFVPKRLVSGRKQKDFAMDSAREPARSRVIAFVNSTWVFLLSLYKVISWNMTFVQSVERRQAKQEIRSGWKFYRTCFHSCLTCLEGGKFDPLWSSNGWGIWPSKLAT